MEVNAEQLELKCREAIETLQGELKMEYVTSWERFGIQKGISNRSGLSIPNIF